jgi:putative transposase
MGIRLLKDRVRFKGLPGELRLGMHRPLPERGLLVGCTFHRDLRGWVIGLAVELDEAAPRPIQKAVGLDLGVAALAVLSDGSTIPNIKVATRTSKRRTRLQRALSRKMPLSKGRGRARANLARCCAQATRRRSDHLHQASARLASAYDLIAIERLEVGRLAAGMLAASVRDAAWGRFILMLKYKAKRVGAEIVQVDPRDTTQSCSRCGARSEKALRDRWHHCGCCGLSIDRDHNSALNILHRAGVGPGLLNVAVSGMRASEKPLVYGPEALPYMCSPPKDLQHVEPSYAYMWRPPLTDRLVPVM